MTTLDTPSTRPARRASPPSRAPAAWGRYLASLRLVVVLTVLLGIAYPLVVLGVAQLPGLRARADGSLVRDAHGSIAGSSLIGQAFADASGRPLRQWFQPRPSAAGNPPGYDPTSSGASNLGPSNPTLVTLIAQRRAAVAAFDAVPGHPVAAQDVPADAVTASGSGLDPDISAAYAREQAYRVAAARGLAPARVLALVDAHIQGRALGFMGEPVVNVLQLNLDLERTTG